MCSSICLSSPALSPSINPLPSPFSLFLPPPPFSLFLPSPPPCLHFTLSAFLPPLSPFHTPSPASSLLSLPPTGQECEDVKLVGGGSIECFTPPQPATLPYYPGIYIVHTYAVYITLYIVHTIPQVHIVHCTLYICYMYVHYTLQYTLYPTTRYTLIHAVYIISIHWFCVLIQISGGRGLLREVWIGGNWWFIDSFLNEPRSGLTSIQERAYRDSSSSREFGERYYFIQRYSGFFVPPVTSLYTFSILSDDLSRLYVSPSMDADEKQLIAYADVHTTNMWNRYETQTSAPMMMKRGQYYYMEVYSNQGSGK